ncbi:MAG: C39 family peptidase [Planctomycetota bacterium]
MPCLSWRSRRFLPGILGVLLPAAGCQSGPPAPATGAVHRIEAPFIRQEPNWCGQAALAACLGHWGKSIPQEDIARSTYAASLRGTLTTDLVLFARKQGFWARSFHGGSIDDLKRMIRQDIPVIILLKSGPAWSPTRHYDLIIGFDEPRRALIAHTGARAGALIPLDRFKKTWERTGRWAMIVLPPDTSPEGLEGEDYLEIGLLAEKRAMLDAARTHYEKALGFPATAKTALFRLGNIDIKEKHFASAGNRFQNLLRQEELSETPSPSWKAILQNHCAWVILESGGGPGEAEALVVAALERDPDRKVFYLDTLARVRIFQGRTEEALKILAEAGQAIPPGTPDTVAADIRATLRLHASEAHRLAGKPREAAQALGEALLEAHDPCLVKDLREAVDRMEKATRPGIAPETKTAPESPAPSIPQP